MARKLPPFSAIRAFEAAARHRSFKKAASELCLSPSAISHQVRALEAYLDTALFERSGTGVELTLTGRNYAGKIGGLLDTLDDATRSIREAGNKQFRIECTPGFAARWLVPRLGRLKFGNRVRLRVSSGAPSTDFSSNDADVVIQWSDDFVSGVRTEPLMQSNRFPVISPDLLRRENLQTPSDLLRMTLMHDEVMDGWPEWFAAAGIKAPERHLGPVFPNCELATTAAEQGQGVSLAYSAVVSGTLASGRLVRLFDAVTLPIVIYSVAYLESRSEDPMIREFCDWISGEVSRDGSGLTHAHSGMHLSEATTR